MAPVKQGFVRRTKNGPFGPLGHSARIFSILSSWEAAPNRLISHMISHQPGRLVDPSQSCIYQDFYIIYTTLLCSIEYIIHSKASIRTSWNSWPLWCTTEFGRYIVLSLDLLSSSHTKKMEQTAKTSCYYKQGNNMELIFAIFAGGCSRDYSCSIFPMLLKYPISKQGLFSTNSYYTLPITKLPKV